MLHHLYIVQYCTVMESIVWGRFESMRETIAAVSDKNKPNRKYSKRFNWGKCMLNAEFLWSKPCQMNLLPHKVNRFFCK